MQSRLGTVSYCIQWNTATVELSCQADAHETPNDRVYVLRSANRIPAAPAILHMQGGGYVAADPLRGISPSRKGTAALDCVIFGTIDRPPETTFTGSIEA
jgi:hypothetical protein